MRKLIATTTLAAAVTGATIGLAAPAKATVVEEAHCPHAITVEEVVCLVCTIAIPVLETATGRDWQCSGS